MVRSSDMLPKTKRPFRALTYIVGHSRGGTTWLGELVACAESVRYIFEPFASQAHPCTGIDMQTVFNGGRLIHKGKLGRPVPDIPIPRFFRDAATDATGLLGILAATHLRELAARAFPNDSGYHLVVKQPRIENVSWATDAIAADRIVAIDRHPLGVVNSVLRWRMLNWTRIEWAIIGRDDTLADDVRPLVADAKTPEERLLVLSWLRSRHLRSFAASRPGAILVDYESLCLDPFAQTLLIWRHMGVSTGAGDRGKLAELLTKRGDGEDKRARFLNVHRDPLTRLHAWRHELPDGLRKRLEFFIRKHSLPIPLPGDGLPELSPVERMLARRNGFLAIGSHCRRLLESIAVRDRAKAA